MFPLSSYSLHHLTLHGCLVSDHFLDLVMVVEGVLRSTSFGDKQPDDLVLEHGRSCEIKPLNPQLPIIPRMIR